MPVKIRLQRKGRKKRPFYHIVVADSRAPRDGRFIEKIGTYDPMTKPATIDLDRDAAFEWMMKGAQPTDTARAILRFKGVLYRKHLMRGVRKGSLTQEEAIAKYNQWIEEKEARIAARVKATQEEKEAFHKMISGVAPARPVEEPVEEVAEETAEAPAEGTTEEAPATPEAITEEAPAAEAPAEEPAADDATEEKTDE